MSSVCAPTSKFHMATVSMLVMLGTCKIYRWSGPHMLQNVPVSYLVCIRMLLVFRVLLGMQEPVPRKTTCGNFCIASASVSISFCFSSARASGNPSIHCVSSINSCVFNFNSPSLQQNINTVIPQKGLKS